MKKIYSILLVGILLVFSSTTLDASTTEESKKNLIDLSNLIINDYQVDGLSGTRSLEMANPANVLGDQVTALLRKSGTHRYHLKEHIV